MELIFYKSEFSVLLFESMFPGVFASCETTEILYLTLWKNYCCIKILHGVYCNSIENMSKLLQSKKKWLIYNFATKCHKNMKDKWWSQIAILLFFDGFIWIVGIIN